MPAQRGYFDEAFPVGTSEAYQPFLQRQPWGNAPFTGTQLGQRRQDFFPPPRVAPSRAPEPSTPLSIDREPPSARQGFQKEVSSFLETESPEAGGMTLLDILSVPSLPAQRNLISSDPSGFGLGNLGEDRLNEFLLGASRNDPRVFLRQLLRRMRLRPSSLLGGL